MNKFLAEKKKINKIKGGTNATVPVFSDMICKQI